MLQLPFLGYWMEHKPRSGSMKGGWTYYNGFFAIIRRASVSQRGRIQNTRTGGEQWGFHIHAKLTHVFRLTLLENL